MTTTLTVAAAQPAVTSGDLQGSVQAHSQHTAGTAALGVDVNAAGLVHAPDELAEDEARAVVGRADL